MQFRYQVRDTGRRLVEGTLEATSLESADRKLRRYFSDIVYVKPVQSWLPRWRRKIKVASLAIFLRQLSAMIDAGIPLYKSLRFLQDGEDIRLNEVILQMSTRIEQGWRFTQCMREHPDAFSPLILALIKAGEESGTLPRTLARVCDLLERTVRFSQRLGAALIYPLLLMAVTLAVVLLFAVFLVPRMEDIYTSIGSNLPGITRALIFVVNFVTSPYTLAAVVALLAITPFLFRYLWSNDRFRFWLDDIVLDLPLLGPLLHKSITAQMAYAFSMLLEAGVPLTAQLSVVEHMANNEVIAARFRQAQVQMVSGVGFHDALADCRVFSPTALHLVRAGEEAGQLDRLMRKVGQLYEEKLDFAMQDFANMLEPLALGIMGMVVCFVALATGLPIMNLVQNL